jgi:putative SOS response-associated peptidase YedK
MASGDSSSRVRAGVRYGLQGRPVWVRLKVRHAIKNRARTYEAHQLLSCTIITTAPNDFEKRFHDRMPCDTGRSRLRSKLTGSDVSDLLKAPHNEVLINYPVSGQVNSVKNKDASLRSSRSRNPHRLFQ